MSDVETNPVPEQDQLQLLAKVRSTLRSEPLLGPSFHLRDLRIERDGSLILDGNHRRRVSRSLDIFHPTIGTRADSGQAAAHADPDHHREDEPSA